MSQPLREKVRELSQALIQAQSSIGILDAIKWGPAVEADFFKHKCQELPKLSLENYGRLPLGFDASAKREELNRIKARIDKELGDADGLGAILQDIVDCYVDAASLLEKRGTAEFNRFSRKLWGSAQDVFLTEGQTLGEYAQAFSGILNGMDQRSFQADYEKSLSASDVVQMLRERFAKFEFLAQIDVLESDGIVADAAAGGSSIKIRPDAQFSMKDVDILEVHEGHTHVATSLNGRKQTYAQWLSCGPPRSTSTQEGLAVLMETLTMCTYPQRVKKINDRVRAISLAEQGGDPLDVFRFLQDEGYDERAAYRMMMRIFRGTDLKGGSAFTKDLSYMKGLIECYNFVFSCLSENASEHIRFLYAGKVKLADVPVLTYHARTGVVEAPPWLPPVFRAQDELASWFIFPAQLGQLHDDQLQAQFRRQIRHYQSP